MSTDTEAESPMRKRGVVHKKGRTMSKIKPILESIELNVVRGKGTAKKPYYLRKRQRLENMIINSKYCLSCDRCNPFDISHMIINDIMDFTCCSTCKNNCCVERTPYVTEKERIKLQTKYGKKSVVKDRNNDWEISRNKKGECIFLSKTGCILPLHEKPHVCMLFPIYLVNNSKKEWRYMENDENKLKGNWEYRIEMSCPSAQELIKEILKPKSRFDFSQYCKLCKCDCCGLVYGHLEDEGPLLRKSELKAFKKKYGEDSVNKRGYIKTVGDSKVESMCILFDTSIPDCIVKRKDRPQECLLYPFTYIYNKEGKIKRTEYTLEMECLFARVLVHELTKHHRL